MCKYVNKVCVESRVAGETLAPTHKLHECHSAALEVILWPKIKLQPMPRECSENEEFSMGEESG